MLLQLRDGLGQGEIPCLLSPQTPQTRLDAHRCYVRTDVWQLTAPHRARDVCPYWDPFIPNVDGTGQDGNFKGPKDRAKREQFIILLSDKPSPLRNTLVSNSSLHFSLDMPFRKMVLRTPREKLRKASQSVQDRSRRCWTPTATLLAFHYGPPPRVFHSLNQVHIYLASIGIQDYFRA
jgi:hypothetical protein